METALGVTRRTRRFEELYAEHGPDALHVAYLLIGDRAAAEDLVHDAFVRLLGRFGDLRKPDAFRTYLLRTVTNLAKNEYRRRARPAPREPEVTATGSALEERDALVRELRRLPHRQQAALVLRYCCDLSEQQTAEVLDTTPKAVRSLITRGLAAMREQEEVLR